MHLHCRREHPNSPGACPSISSTTMSIAEPLAKPRIGPIARSKRSLTLSRPSPPPPPLHSCSVLTLTGRALKRTEKPVASPTPAVNTSASKTRTPPEQRLWPLPPPSPRHQAFVEKPVTFKGNSSELARFFYTTCC